MSEPPTPGHPYEPPRLLPRALPPTDGPGPFLARTLRLPFTPALWSAARRWTVWQVLLPVALLAVVLDGGLAFLRAGEVRGELRLWSRGYDASYPAVVVENGNVRVEGGGAIRWAEGDTTFLVDPEETVPIDSIQTREALVVRRTEIIRVRSFGRNEVTKVADLQTVLGDPLRFDGESLARFESRWGFVLVLGLGGMLLAFLLVGEALCAAFCVAAGGGLALLLRGRALGRSYGECTRVALAAYAPVIALGLVLNVAGLSPGACLGPLLWATLVTALTAWRIGE